MTRGTAEGAIRAVIVSGPPGVGKSFGVESVLERDNLFNFMSSTKPKFEVVKGAMSPIGLYKKLYQMSNEGDVLVFDDCDAVLFDDLSLNLLKAALDTSDRRYVCWNSESRVLKNEGIPEKFEFKAAVIFITNVKFDHVRSKKLRDHLEALESRCLYLDLSMNSARDKMIRIKQIVKGGMLDKFQLKKAEQDEVVKWVDDNRARLRELSLRTVLKVAGLRKSSPARWERMAELSCCKK